MKYVGEVVLYKFVFTELQFKTVLDELDRVENNMAGSRSLRLLQWPHQAYSSWYRRYRYDSSFGGSMWLAPPMVMLKSRLHPLLSYRWPLSLFRGVYSSLCLMGQQPLSLMVMVIRLQWPRLKRSKTSVYPFMTSLMQGGKRLSERGCVGDEVCIWRNAEVLSKRCHFHCSIINLPIPSADGITAYQQLMWEVFSVQYWERVGIHEFDFCFTDHWQGSSAKFAYHPAILIWSLPTPQHGRWTKRVK